MESKTGKTIFSGSLLVASLLFLFCELRLQNNIMKQLPAGSQMTQKSAFHIAARTRHPKQDIVVAENVNMHHAQVTADTDTKSMNLRRFGLHQYLINFEGVATYQGKPCPNASILARISTTDGSQAVGAITKDDGTYSIQILVESMPNKPIDWIVEGYTPEFKKVEMVGRRISTDDNEPIGVEQEVAFLTPQLQTESAAEASGN